MVKRITISVSDELHSKIQQFKDGFRKKDSISKICQMAIEKELDDAIRRDAVYKDGFQYGLTYVESLTANEGKKIKKLVSNFPRNYPEKLIDIYIKAGLIDQHSLPKHFEILNLWNDCVYERVREITEFVDHDDWDEWLGTPPTHEGVEIWETQIPYELGTFTTPDGKEFKMTNNKTSADIRHEAMRNLWREGLIAGIKEATKSIQEGENEDE